MNKENVKSMRNARQDDGSAGGQEVCKNEFHRHSVTVDVVIFSIEEDELRTLIIERSNEPFTGSPALPGGFLREDEKTHAAAERILKEKAGVENVYIEQLYTFDDIGRDPRGSIITIAYYAIVPRDKINMLVSERTENPKFIPNTKLPRLAFDHDKIVKYAVERLQAKIEYTNLSYSLLPETFTLTELQKIYEAVLGKKLDKRNFRKKFLQLDLIAQTGKIVQGGRQRPARQYRFKKQKLTELKKFF